MLLCCLIFIKKYLSKSKTFVSILRFIIFRISFSVAITDDWIFPWRCPKAIWMFFECYLTFFGIFQFFWSCLVAWPTFMCILSKLKSWTSSIYRRLWNYSTYLLIYILELFAVFFTFKTHSGPSHIHGNSRSLANWCSQITYILKNDVNKSFV